MVGLTIISRSAIQQGRAITFPASKVGPDWTGVAYVRTKWAVRVTGWAHAGYSTAMRLEIHENVKRLEGALCQTTKQ